MTIEKVETMTNNIGNIEQNHNHFYGRQPRPINKVVPLPESEGGLSLKQKTYFTETINKICELGKIAKAPRATHANVRSSVNRAGGVTTVSLYPANSYWHGVIELEKWIAPLLVHESRFNESA
jgi:hypothetical protein